LLFFTLSLHTAELPHPFLCFWTPREAFRGAESFSLSCHGERFLLTPLSVGEVKFSIMATHAHPIKNLTGLCPPPPPKLPQPCRFRSLWESLILIPSPEPPFPERQFLVCFLLRVFRSAWARERRLLIFDYIRMILPLGLNLFGDPRELPFFFGCPSPYLSFVASPPR